MHTEAVRKITPGMKSVLIPASTFEALKQVQQDAKALSLPLRFDLSAIATAAVTLALADPACRRTLGRHARMAAPK